MKPNHTKIRKLLKSKHMKVCIAKLLLECWNHPHPHFGGYGPHRYDGNAKECGYCSRPKSWKTVNAGFHASEIVYGDAK